MFINHLECLTHGKRSVKNIIIYCYYYHYYYIHTRKRGGNPRQSQVGCFGGEGFSRSGWIKVEQGERGSVGIKEETRLFDPQNHMN